MLHKKHKIHFVGIGGIGMSGIAEVLLNSGYVVSGSDLQESDATAAFARSWRRCVCGPPRGQSCRESFGGSDFHRGKYSNPEVLEARRRHIPVIPRAEMLAELMR
jgi:UDP-N-acetylmuramate--alanine ligase